VTTQRRSIFRFGVGLGQYTVYPPSLPMGRWLLIANYGESINSISEGLAQRIAF